MTNKIEKNLQFTCPTCFSVFQLLEIHEQESQTCLAHCQAQWQAILSKHYQDHIILHLAREEAEKDQKKEGQHE